MSPGSLSIQLKIGVTGVQAFDTPTFAVTVRGVEFAGFTVHVSSVPSNFTPKTPLNTPGLKVLTWPRASGAGWKKFCPPVVALRPAVIVTALDEVFSYPKNAVDVP